MVRVLFADALRRGERRRELCRALPSNGSVPLLLSSPGGASVILPDRTRAVAMDYPSSSAGTQDAAWPGWSLLCVWRCVWR